MTRINLVEPSYICDKQLFAELREMTRIPNRVLKMAQHGTPLPPDPPDYTVRLDDEPETGVGHVTFFLRRLQFLRNRYDEIYKELKARGLNPTWNWPTEGWDEPWCEYILAQQVIWRPTPQNIQRSRQRIDETLRRMKTVPKWSPYVESDPG